MNIHFEPDFQKKILFIAFSEPVTINTLDSIAEWRRQWLEALKQWHSPYKAMLDCRNLNIDSQDSEFEKVLHRMFTFLKGLFLKKIVGFGLNDQQGHSKLPFPVLKTEEEASQELGIRQRQLNPESEDFRTLIAIENRFEQQVIELSFLSPVVLDKAKIAILKSKLTNNLMHWHSGWSLLIECENLSIPKEFFSEFEYMIKFFKGFFLKELAGHKMLKTVEEYPFAVYRARHKAAAMLKSETPGSGQKAHCRSDKKS